MADVELVIRISQEDYEAIKDNSIVGDMTIPYIFEAIRNGVQIPEEHGRLIDAKDVGEYLTLADVPTIIEANEESEK